MTREQAMELDESEVAFLAARVRRLCQHFGYSFPKKENDQFIVAVAAALIGGVLTKLELEKRNVPDLEQQAKDAARYRALRDWMIASDENDPFTPHLDALLLKILRERGEDAYPTPEEYDAAIDAAMKESGHD